HLPRMCAELAESAQYPVSVVEVREQRFQSFRDRQLVDVAQRLVSPEREKDVDGIAPPDRVQLFSEQGFAPRTLRLTGHRVRGHQEAAAVQVDGLGHQVRLENLDRAAEIAE